MYRRMCMSGWQAAQERKKQENRNSQARLDRRSKILLAIEYAIRDGSAWLFGEEFDGKFTRHLEKRALIIKKITPILAELAEDGKIVISDEFFPKEGVFRLLVAMPPREERRTRRRAVDL